MNRISPPIVLGSRSPRRRELLALLVGDDQIVVRPPRDSAEPSMVGVQTLDQLHGQIADLARQKSDDVVSQLNADGSLPDLAAIVTADTVIAASDGNGIPVVLGQPPVGDGWQQVVRDWFHRFYIGRSHQAVTAVCVRLPTGVADHRVVTTTLHFRDDAEEWLDWYLATNESIGKAGGYGLQGAGSLFVEQILGSPSNVVGLPLLETAEMLRTAGVLP